MKYSINVNGNEKIPFNNNVNYCVGTGRMGLALTKEYYDQLKIVQQDIGFKFIRGHGLFCDDVGIYQEYLDKTGLKEPKDFADYKAYMEYVEQNAKKIIEYNFTYLDRVVDSYIELNIRPFLELGFMPYKMASGDNTVFYWKGNTTPPADYTKWCNMVQATLRHLMDRYGESEVLSWPIEVWNEPNLPGFWKDANIDEYFKLYELTSAAIKNVDQRFKVGGPAICGGADEKWMKGFLTYCHEHKLPLDFISRHHYCTEIPEDIGHYGYPKMMELDYTLQTLADCRKIIESFDEYKSLPFYITEFNTSYIPNCPVHDTNLNAAYIARTLAEIGDYATGYSYWTFGDVFEERGIPFTPFHGGFGLLANGGIPKPTYWTFKFFKDLQADEESCVYRDKNIVIVKTKSGSYKGIAWNLTIETKEDEMDFEVVLPAVHKGQGRMCLLTKSVDEECCNPLKVWHDLGEWTHPTDAQNELLKSAANPLVKTSVIEADGDKSKISLTVKKHGVVYFEFVPASITSDRGYDYDFNYGK
ncbi:MAG: glycosyl hydrolase [Treponema sp.]|nr:glycosyl hydrolase [Treponema sp.]